jgi:hypothetical protein
MDGHYYIEWSGKSDGVLYPVKGNPYVGMASVKKLKANSLLFVHKMAGNNVGQWRYTVSKDGKTLTVTGRGKTPIEGKDYSSTKVYEKQ